MARKKNLDVGSGYLHIHKQHQDCLRVDIQPGPLVDRVCSVYTLPFPNNSFEKVYCTHVLEHLVDPVAALKELIRVARSTVILEVPHKYSMNAKQDSRNPHDKHFCSFRTSWFHKVLAKIPHHIEVVYRFPFYLYIQVEVYLD